MKKILITALVCLIQCSASDGSIQSISYQSLEKQPIEKFFNYLDTHSIKYNTLAGLGQILFGIAVLPVMVKEKFFSEELLEPYNYDMIHFDVLRTSMGLVCIGSGGYDLVVKVPCLVVQDLKKRVGWSSN